MSLNSCLNDLDFVRLIVYRHTHTDPRNIALNLQNENNHVINSYSVQELYQIRHLAPTIYVALRPCVTISCRLRLVSALYCDGTCVKTVTGNLASDVQSDLGDNPDNWRLIRWIQLSVSTPGQRYGTVEPQGRRPLGSLHELNTENDSCHQ